MITYSDVQNQQTRARKKRYNDRVKKGQRIQRRVKKYTRDDILAIDGEGETDGNGVHHYTLLATSDGQYIEGSSLSTFECFEFLSSLDPKRLIVGFSLSYDVSMMLKDFSQEQCLKVWQGERVRYAWFRFEYTPRREFTIWNDRTGTRVHVFDVFGFFQSSFVNALREWKVADDATIARIKEMKDLRGTFDSSMRARIRQYCIDECQLLVDLMERLIDAVQFAEIPVHRWYGAGAIASGVLRRECVGEYIRSIPEILKAPVLSAYFGGRFELAESGTHRSVHVYDIRSAYPYQLLRVPCMQHLRYRFTFEYADTELGLWHVRWNVPKDSPWPPFPFRTKDAIIYPYQGEGWYYADEVKAARELFGDSIEVLDGIEITRMCDHSPFRFVPDLYRYRAELKRQGNHAQQAIKLGLNSLYGKTAQGVGHKDRKPPYQSYLWAGMITSGTRAMILRAIAQNPNAIIEVATDSIASTVPLDLPIGDNLGEWEYNHYDETFSVQPGVYDLVKDGEHKTRSRGFGKSDVDWDALRAAYADDPLAGIHRYTVTRFIALGGAVHSPRFDSIFRRWIEMERCVTFCPSRRIPEPFTHAAFDPQLYCSDPHYNEAWRLRFAGDATVRLHAPGPPPDQPVSRPYEPAQSWDGQWSEWVNDPETAIDQEQP